MILFPPLLCARFANTLPSAYGGARRTGRGWGTVPDHRLSFSLDAISAALTNTGSRVSGGDGIPAALA